MMIYLSKEKYNVVYKMSDSEGYTVSHIKKALYDDWQTVVTVPVPAKEIVTFEVVTLLGGGKGGVYNCVVVE